MLFVFGTTFSDVDTSLRGESFKDARRDFRVPTRASFFSTTLPTSLSDSEAAVWVFTSVLPANGVDGELLEETSFDEEVETPRLVLPSGVESDAVFLKMFLASTRLLRR